MFRRIRDRIWKRVGSGTVKEKRSNPDSGFLEGRIGSESVFFSKPCLRVEKTLSSILTNGNAHLLGEDEVQLEEKDAPLATLSDQLLRVPHVEGVLQTLLMLNRLTN